MSFSGSDPLMNLYLEKSHRVATKPHLELVVPRASSPAWQEDHFIYPLPKRGQPAHLWKSLGWRTMGETMT